MQSAKNPVMEILYIKYCKILTHIITILESDNEIKTVRKLTNDILQQKKTTPPPPPPKKLGKLQTLHGKPLVRQYLLF